MSRFPKSNPLPTFSSHLGKEIEAELNIRYFRHEKFGFVPKVCDTKNTYLLKKGKGSTPDTKVGRYGNCSVRRFCRTFKEFGKAPFFGKSINLMVITDIWDNVKNFKI